MIIDRLHAVAATSHKTVASLPARLNAEACIDVLSRLGLDGVVAIAASTGNYIDIADVDKALSTTTLSVGDKMRLKESLSANGLLSRGRKVS